MVLEATVVCLDNSDWMRNGDYTPTRLDAQHDAINLICGAKTQSNPESAVGVVACSGRSPEVLVTLTSDIGKVLSSLHGIRMNGALDFAAGLQVAQLVLKHRQNKNQHQRIIFFVGSPIKSDKESLVKLGKRLKKNNVAVDIVNFGEEAENTEKLEAFLGAVNSNDNSHLVTIPPGPHILSDILISSPILAGGEGMPGAVATGSADFEAYGGIDPSLDPELAMVLKMSMEEERARQEASRKDSGPTEEGSTATAPTGTAAQTTNEVEMREAPAEDDDDLLREALALSMMPTPAGTQTSSSTTAPSTATTTSKPSTTTTSSTTDVDMDDLNEDQQMALAMQMSMSHTQSTADSSKKEQGGGGGDLDRVMQDPNFVNNVLSSLPGVDPNDERIKNALKNLQDKDKEDKDKK